MGYYFQTFLPQALPDLSEDEPDMVVLHNVPRARYLHLMTNHLKNENVRKINDLFTNVVDYVTYTDIDKDNFEEVLKMDNLILESLNESYSFFEPLMDENHKIEYNIIMNTIAELCKALVALYKDDIVNNPIGAVNADWDELAHILKKLEPVSSEFEAYLRKELPEAQEAFSTFMKSLYSTHKPEEISKEVEHVLESLLKYFEKIYVSLSVVKGKQAEEAFTELYRLIDHVAAQLHQIR